MRATFIKGLFLLGSPAQVFNAGHFLEAYEIEQVVTCGKLFMRLYLQMANTAREREALLWKCRPKLHLFHHFILACEKASGRNPVWDATFMDEDSCITYIMS